MLHHHKNPPGISLTMPRPDLATNFQRRALSPAHTMLPQPSLSITIPSIHDDVTTLECRVYHPQSLAAGPHSPPWRRHAAVIAHPYASLGGCYDDAVVVTLASTLLRRGYVVGTFNFRGAGRSTGKTSWTSKPERGDYISFAAFVYYYCHYLDPFRPQGESKSPVGLTSVVNSTTSPTTTTTATATATAAATGADPPAEALPPGESPVLLLCGYSYGAMVTKLLPPVDTMLKPFATPKTASAAADIRLRAQHLAEKQNVILGSARASLAEDPTSPRKAAFGMRVGGDEDSRRSQEHGRRSFSLDAEEKIRKGVAELMQRAKSGQLHHHHRKKKTGLGESDMPVVKEVEEERGSTGGNQPDALPPVAGLVTPRVAYLLVSPPVGWATSLLTMNVGGSMSNVFTKRPKSPRSKDKAGQSTKQSSDSIEARQEEHKQKLVDNPTIAIYGDADLFVAAKKFREWAAKLQNVPGSKFRAHEVSTAGHFYIEDGTMQRLADAVGVFSGELLSSETNAA